MKKNTNEIPDMETIKRYWGSLEAYQEEQRRTAIVTLEAEAYRPGVAWNWNFSFGRNSEKKETGRRLLTPHFFGRHS